MGRRINGSAAGSAATQATRKRSDSHYMKEFWGQVMFLAIAGGAP
jgi:hypothetical protein